MNISNKIPQIVVGVLLLMLVYLGYQTFFVEDPLDPGGPTQIAEGEELLRMLTEMRGIELRGDVFQNPIFRSLHDFSLTVRSEPIGRNNPFAPINESEEFDGQAFVFEGAGGFFEAPAQDQNDQDDLGEVWDETETWEDDTSDEEEEWDGGDEGENGGLGDISLPSAPAAPGGM